jgi:hypothetical protein
MKGTLNNFQSDGAISADSIKWLLRSGKVPIGKERTQLIDREQLRNWGVLIEHKAGIVKPDSPKITKKKIRPKKRVILPVVQEEAAATEELSSNV